MTIMTRVCILSKWCGKTPLLRIYIFQLDSLGKHYQIQNQYAALEEFDVTQISFETIMQIEKQRCV